MRAAVGPSLLWRGAAGGDGFGMRGRGEVGRRQAVWWWIRLRTSDNNEYVLRWEARRQGQHLVTSARWSDP
jgi:hypothetical protein